MRPSPGWTNPLKQEWANPLRDARDKRMPTIAGPCGLVIFGVTGDLARKKLMPAVYDLANRGLLPPGFALVGFARRDWADEDFGQIVHDAVREHARTPFREDVWNTLAEGFRFVSGSFDDDAAFDDLARCLAELDRVRGTGGNHAFYLSVPPGAFPTVCEQLSRSGLAKQTDGEWRRVAIEKPFGHDLDSARALNAVVNEVFPEDSVFRIDHYLGKETVQNILALRFDDNELPVLSGIDRTGSGCCGSLYRLRIGGLPRPRCDPFPPDYACGRPGSRVGARSCPVGSLHKLRCHRGRPIVVLSANSVSPAMSVGPF